MVHALKKVKPWLSPEGYILVIHDLVDPPRIEIHNQNQQHYAGQLFSKDGFENQRMADQAIDQVVQEGLFSSSQSQIFENYDRADSLTSLLDWLAETWESTYMTDGTKRKIDDLVEQMGWESEVVLHMLTRIVKLDPA